ncbi:RNA-binding ribosome biosynthesis protein mak21, partial [Coemansia spiralis]
GPKAKESKAKAKSTNADDAETTPMPGLKIKSAKDAKPLGKAGRLIVRPTPQWFSIELDALEVNKDAAKPTEEEALQKLQFAEQLLERENELYENSGFQQRSLSTADKSFVSNILSSGTLTDRVSALTLIVQESPVHNLRSLRQLMQMVQKKNRREALLAVGCVKDLMLLNLLPADRKLKHFVDQPIGAAGVTNAHWVLWAFEDKLKRHYFDLIQVMETLSYDPVLHTRQNMVAFFEDLLEKKPEQEQNLLRLLVNKLGDKERQLAAKASYLILRLLNAHPNMKHIVVRTIQELLLTRSSTKERAQYYTMITLNQVVLSSKDVGTANLLLDVYFTFFKKLLGATAAADAAAEEADAEGVSTPAGPAAAKKGAKQVRIGQKAMRQAKEEAEKQRAEEERSMDNRLLAAILTGLNRALPFSKLEDSAMDKHIGTIFQIAHAGNFNTVVQSLVLLSQIARMRPAVSDRFYRTLYDSLLDPRLDQTSKKAMYLNVLFRALKADSDAPRVMAFLKRIMQVCLYSQAELASGALLLASQVLSVHPQAQAMLTQPEDNDGDAAGVFDPLKRDPRFAHAEASCLWEATLLARHFHPSITHSVEQVLDGKPVAAISNLHNHSLVHFLDRFVFRKPKAGQAAADDDDDVADGKGSLLRGQSLMQPLVSMDDPDMVLGSGRARIAAGDTLITSKRIGGLVGGLDLTSEAILSLKKSEVRPDEQFFHQFFQTKKARMGNKVKKSKRRDADDDDAADDDGAEFADDDTGFAGAMQAGEGEMDEDEIWKAMSSSMPGGAPSDIDDDSVDGDDDDNLLDALRDDDDEVSDSDNDDDELANLDDDSDIDEISDADQPESADEQDSASDKQEDAAAAAGAKRKDGTGDEAPATKRKKKEKMPLFASFDDYAHLIDTDDGLE